MYMASDWILFVAVFWRDNDFPSVIFEYQRQERRLLITVKNNWLIINSFNSYWGTESYVALGQRGHSRRASQRKQRHYRINLARSKKSGYDKKDGLKAKDTTNTGQLREKKVVTKGIQVNFYLPIVKTLRKWVTHFSFARLSPRGDYWLPNDLHCAFWSVWK